MEESTENEIVLRLVYSSEATCEFDSDALLQLLERARENNARMNVSGMLLYSDGTFLQVLEGDPEVVEALYDKIGQDERHTDTRVLLRTDDEARAFGDWTMGFVKASKQLLAEVAGLNDFLQSNLPRVGTESETAERTAKILEQFKEGRWRRQIEG